MQIIDYSHQNFTPETQPNSPVKFTEIFTAAMIFLVPVLVLLVIAK